MESANILIVEYERIIALDLQNILSENGYCNTRLAFSAVEALDSLTAARPDLMLIDETLESSFDGRKVGKKARRDYNIPVIFLSSGDGISLNKSGVEGASGCAYVAKPFRREEIVHSVRMVLENNRHPLLC